MDCTPIARRLYSLCSVGVESVYQPVYIPCSSPPISLFNRLHAHALPYQARRLCLLDGHLVFDELHELKREEKFGADGQTGAVSVPFLP